MGLRLGSQAIPAVRLYKSGAKYPTGIIEIGASGNYLSLTNKTPDVPQNTRI